jgi:hypothetical protein
MLVIGATLVGCRAAPSTRVGESITANDMQARISFLASDLLLGRATPSHGLDVAADYVASEFGRLGLESPPGGYLQRYRLAMGDMGPSWTLVLRRDGRRVTLRHQEEFWGVPWAAGTVEGIVRFVGDRPAEAPAEGTETLWVARLTPATTPREWLAAATRAGAVGLVLIVAGEPGPHVRDWLEEGQSAYELGDVEPSLPAVLVSQEPLLGAIERLGVELQSPVVWTDLDSSGARVQLSADLRVETLAAPNVMGILPGSDERLRREFVLISAHMDGLGVGLSVDGDSIYNGADDNASGTAAVLEVAEAMAGLSDRPKRSVAFLAVSGEEKGLLGSSWFVENPPIPLERIIANVNIDMIGRNWEDTISVIGGRFSTLGALIDSVAAANPELGIAVVGDRWPDQGFFFRSDHFNFARKGVPAVFFFNGVHEDYHRPSDEVHKIGFAKAARISRLVFEVALALADAETPPSWHPDARARIVEGSH